MNCCTRFTLAAVASLVLFGCRDNTVTPPSSGPVFAVSDGAHNGNPDFFFLSPMFNNPICLLGLPAPDGTRDCVGAPVTRFGPSQISLNSTDQLYQVNWNTDLSNLNVANFYRIQVLVGTRVLGFADVDPVVSLTGRQLQNLQTGEYIPLVDGRTLPIKFRIETGVLCATDGTPCNSSTINLNTGGTIELLGAGEDFKLDIRPGTAATFGGQPVSDVTFNLEVCGGIDVDLPTFSPCFRVSTYFNATGTGPLEFSTPILLSMCVLNSTYHTLDETRQEGLITLHQQDGTLIRALPHAQPNCDESGTIGTRGWGWLRELAARFLAPQPAYAATRSALLHVGAGGETSSTGDQCAPSPSAVVVPGMSLTTTCPPSSPAIVQSGPQRVTTALIDPPRTVSDFQFALPAKMDYLNRADSDRTAPAGTALPTAVKVTDWDGSAVEGARVTFVEPAIEGPPTVIGTATSNADGVAQIAWTIRAGSNTAVATGRGIAAQNNYPGGTVTPFMPDIDSPDPETPVALGTGKVTFRATGIVGGLYLIRDSDDMLQRLDPLSLTITNIGALGVGYMFGDCAWNPSNNTLYMVEGRATNTLYTVNTTTGAATAVGVHGITDMFALGFYPPTGQMFAASAANGNLYSLDLTTGAATLIGSTGLVSPSINGLAWDPTRRQFIALVSNVSGGSLYSVDVTTAAVTLLADAGPIDNAGLTYDPTIDRFWAAEYQGAIVQYDPTAAFNRTTVATGTGTHTCIARVP